MARAVHTGGMGHDLLLMPDGKGQEDQPLSVRMPCYKYRQAEAAPGDSWCIACSAGEALVRELSSSWASPGSRKLAEDLILSTVLPGYTKPVFVPSVHPVHPPVSRPSIFHPQPRPHPSSIHENACLVSRCPPTTSTKREPKHRRCLWQKQNHTHKNNESPGKNDRED